MDAGDVPEDVGWDVDDEWAGAAGAADANDDDLNWPDEPVEKGGPDLGKAPSPAPMPATSQAGTPRVAHVPPLQLVNPPSAGTAPAAHVPSALPAPKPTHVPGAPAANGGAGVLPHVPEPSAAKAATATAASPPLAGSSPAIVATASTPSMPARAAATAAPQVSAFQAHADAAHSASADAPQPAAPAAVTSAGGAAGGHGRPPTSPLPVHVLHAGKPAAGGAMTPASAASRSRTVSPQPAAPGTGTSSPMGMARTPSARLLAAATSLGHVRRHSNMSGSGAAAAAIAAATGVTMDHAASIGWGGSEASYTYSIGLSEAAAASDGEFDAALADLMQETSEVVPPPVFGGHISLDGELDSGLRPLPAHYNHSHGSTPHTTAASTSVGGAPLPAHFATPPATAAVVTPVPPVPVAHEAHSAVPELSKGFVEAAANPFGDTGSEAEDDDFFGRILSPSQPPAPTINFAAPAVQVSEPKEAVTAWVPAAAAAPWDSPSSSAAPAADAAPPATAFPSASPVPVVSPPQPVSSPHTQVQQGSNLADLFGGSSEHDDLFGGVAASDPNAGMSIGAYDMSAGPAYSQPDASQHTPGYAAGDNGYAAPFNQPKQEATTQHYGGHGYGGYQQHPPATGSYEPATVHAPVHRQYGGYAAAPVSGMFGAGTQDDGSSFFESMDNQPVPQQSAYTPPQPYQVLQSHPVAQPPAQSAQHTPGPLPTVPVQVSATVWSQPNTQPATSNLMAPAAAMPATKPQQSQHTQADTSAGWYGAAVSAPQQPLQQPPQQLDVNAGWNGVSGYGAPSVTPPADTANAWQQPAAVPQTVSTPFSGAPANTAAAAVAAPAAPAWQATDPSTFFDAFASDNLDTPAPATDATSSGDAGSQPHGSTTTPFSQAAGGAVPEWQGQQQQQQQQPTSQDPIAPGHAAPDFTDTASAPTTAVPAAGDGTQGIDPADNSRQARAHRRVFGLTRPPSRLSATGYPINEEEQQQPGSPLSGSGLVQGQIGSEEQVATQQDGIDTATALDSHSVSYGGWLTNNTSAHQASGGLAARSVQSPFANADSSDASFFDGFGNDPDVPAMSDDVSGTQHTTNSATAGAVPQAAVEPEQAHGLQQVQAPQPQQQQQQQQHEAPQQQPQQPQDAAGARSTEVPAGSIVGESAAEQAGPMTPEQIHQWAEYYAQYYSAQYGQEYYSYYYQTYHDQYTQQAQAAAAATQQQGQQQAATESYGSFAAATSPRAGQANPSAQWQPGQASSAWGVQQSAGDAWGSQQPLTSPVPSVTQAAVSPTAWGAAQQQSAAWGMQAGQQPQAQQQPGFFLPGAPQQAQQTANAAAAQPSAGAASAQASAWSAAPPGYGPQASNLYSQQYMVQHKVYAPGSLVELPVSHQAARMCPNGRPGCAVVCFGFGGRVVVVRGAIEPEGGSEEASGMSVTGAPPGLMNGLLVTTTANLSSALASANLLGPMNSGSLGSVPFGASETGTAKKPQEDPMLRLLTSFPGPLAVNTSRDRLLRVLHERATGYAGEDPHAGLEPPEHGQLLWRVLGVMVAHGGHLRTLLAAGGKAAHRADDPASPEADLVRVLSSHTDGSALVGSGGGAGGGLLSGWVLPSRASNTSVLATTAGGPSPGPGSVVGGSGGGAAAVVDAHTMGAPLLPSSLDDARALSGAVEVQALMVQGRRRDALKAATDSGLWGIALLLATMCGGTAFTDTATAMAQTTLQPGTPLRTLSLLLAGRPELAVHAAAEHHAGGAHVGSAPHGLHGSGQAALLASWRENLAVLAGAARGPADLEAIARLGDCMRGEGAQPLAAQLCYLVAGVVPIFNDTGPLGPRNTRVSATGGSAHTGQTVGHRFCLLGVDHVLAPRTYAHALSIQRTEVLEWARLMAGSNTGPQGAGANGPGANDGGASGVLLPLQPYKLVYALLLAEYGRVPEALAYCQALEAVLRGGPGGGGGGSGVARHPQSFMVLVRELEELKERLMTYAQAHAINVGRAESSISKIGRFLDGTLTKLLWGSDNSGSSNAGGGAGSGGAGGPNSHLQGRLGPVEVWGGPSAPVVPLQLAPGVLPQSTSTNAIPRNMSTASSVGNPSAHVHQGPSSRGHRRESSQGDFGGSFANGPHHPYGGMPGAALHGPQVPATAGGWGSHTSQGQFPGGGPPSGGYGSYASSNQGGGHSRTPSGGPWESPAPSFDHPASMQVPGGGSGHGYDDGGAPGGPGRAPHMSGGMAGGPPSQGASGLPPLPVSGSHRQGGQQGPVSQGVAQQVQQQQQHQQVQQQQQHQQQQQQQQQGSQQGQGQGQQSGPPSQKERQEAPKSGKGGWRLLGLFTGGEGGPPAPASKVGGKGSKQPDVGGAGPKKASLGEENKFYFDKAKGRWVMEGQEESAEPPPPAAPPTSFGSTVPGGGASASAPPAGAAGGPSGPPSTGGGGLPANLQRGKGMRNRYVDVFNPSGSRGSSQSGHEVLPPGLLPPGASSTGPPSVGGASMHSANSLLPANSASFSSQPPGFFSPASSALFSGSGASAPAASLYSASFVSGAGGRDTSFGTGGQGAWDEQQQGGTSSTTGMDAGAGGPAPSGQETSFAEHAAAAGAAPSQQQAQGAVAAGHPTAVPILPTQQAFASGTPGTQQVGAADRRAHAASHVGPPAGRGLQPGPQQLASPATAPAVAAARPAGHTAVGPGPGRSAASAVGRSGVGAPGTAAGAGPRPGTTNPSGAAVFANHHTSPAGSHISTPTPVPVPVAHHTAPGQTAGPSINTGATAHEPQPQHHTPTPHQAHTHQPLQHQQPQPQHGGTQWQQDAPSYPAFGYGMSSEQQQLHAASGSTSWGGSAPAAGSGGGGYSGSGMQQGDGYSGGGGSGWGQPHAVGSGWGLASGTNGSDAMEDVDL